MKILTSGQIGEVDKYTIEHEPITSLNLMERAALKIVEFMLEREVWMQLYFGMQAGTAEDSGSIKVFCGIGNNGGDGMVIARHLFLKGYRVEVFKVAFSKKSSPDFAANETKLKNLGCQVHEVIDEKSLPEISGHDLVVDAIFGSGLSRPIKGFTKKLVGDINASGANVLSVDMPSGLFAEDNRENDLEAIVKADITLSFQVPKLVFFYPGYYQYLGDWHLLDIGLHAEAIAQAESNRHFVTPELVKPFLGLRQKFDHKGTYGHALLITGSHGSMGAGVLAARACLRSGAGLVTAHVPKCGVQVLQTAVPEAMVEPNDGENHLIPQFKTEGKTAVGIGPGLGTGDETANALKLLVQNTTAPLVIDADALNILAENKTWLSFLPPDTILTPHPGEFKRLVGNWETDEEKMELLNGFCQKHQVTVVLKGAHTVTCTPSGNWYFNSTGNPGMATGGSGDVLTGIITGLRAQGLAPVKAAVLGVYLHGLAGDLAAERLNETSLIAGDLIRYLPRAFRKVYN